MAKCSDCLHFSICRHYVDADETFLEVGGCSAFKSKGDVVKVIYHKAPQFGSRASFPENLESTFEDAQVSFVEKIYVKMLENYETAVVEEIAAAARSAGVTDCTVLNKKAILDALNKQIPQKPIHDSLADRACPSCDAYIPFDALNDRISDAPNFCKHCGQALDWGKENDDASNL